VNLYSTLWWSISKALRCCSCVTRGWQFYLPPTHEPYLPLLPSYMASTPFGWYSLCLPMKGWPCWVDPGGWLHIDMNVPHQELNPDTVTLPSTNRARRMLTLLIEIRVLPIRQTTTVCLSVCLSATFQWNMFCCWCYIKLLDVTVVSYR